MIVGSSTSENFIKSNVDNQLNINVLKAAIAGATAYEENLVIEKALKNNNLKTIIYGLDFFSFGGNPSRVGDGGRSLPLYLINNTIIDDYKYLLNIDTFLKDIGKIGLANIFGINKKMINFDTFYVSSYNVKLFDFQIAQDITHNLDNYKETMHYSGDTNKWIIKQIKENNYLVTPNNIDEYLKILKTQIEEYLLEKH